jgi:hypothetical protein
MEIARNTQPRCCPYGKVLVGSDFGYTWSGNYCFSTVFDTAELYDPATGTWR